MSVILSRGDNRVGGVSSDAVLRREYAKRMTAPGQAVLRRHGAAPIWTPAALFAGGHPGVAFDPLSLANFRQDVAGTIPATQVGQPSGRLLDISGNGNHASALNPSLIPVIAKSGVMMQGSGGLQTPAIDFSACPIVTLIQRARYKNTITCLISELGPNGYSTFGGFYISKSNSVQSRYGYATNGAYVEPLTIYSPPRADVITCVFDTTNNDYLINVNGVDDPSGLGMLTSGAFANLPLNIGIRSSGGFPALDGISGRQIAIGRALTAGEMAAARTWVGAGSTLLIGDIGDSTIAAYAGGEAVPTFVDAAGAGLAVPGETIAQQKTQWVAYAGKASLGAVVVQVGLNDLDPAEAAAPAIARLQDLVSTINADVSVPVLVSKLIPCRQRLIDIYGGVGGLVAYQKWLDMNAAIAGNGPTPITGADYRIVSHEPLLNDGSGNLAAQFHTGDGIHPNNYGRAINGAAWETALAALGVL